jgi:large subunit GTPase 1
LECLKHLVNDVKEKRFQEDLEVVEEYLEEAKNTNKYTNIAKMANAIQIGMVGYPNVGKSSVINTLCNKKIVGVGSLPGKTKNF